MLNKAVLLVLSLLAFNVNAQDESYYDISIKVAWSHQSDPNGRINAGFIEAINELNQYFQYKGLPVRLRQITSGTPDILVKGGFKKACGVTFRGQNPQVISLNSMMVSATNASLFRTTRHEILHALGVEHTTTGSHTNLMSDYHYPSETAPRWQISCLTTPSSQNYGDSIPSQIMQFMPQRYQANIRQGPPPNTLIAVKKVQPQVSQNQPYVTGRAPSNTVITSPSGEYSYPGYQQEYKPERSKSSLRNKYGDDNWVEGNRVDIISDFPMTRYEGKKANKRVTRTCYKVRVKYNGEIRKACPKEDRPTLIFID